MVLKSDFRSNDSFRSEEMLITNNNIGNSEDNRRYESAISSIGDAQPQKALKYRKKRKITFENY